MKTVVIREGETLQNISERELGDASKWYDIAKLNNLKYPYVSDDYSDTTVRVGDKVKVPSDGSDIDTAIASKHAKGYFDELTYGSDVRVRHTTSSYNTQSSIRLVAADGDLQIVKGKENVVQALLNILNTPVGSLSGHASYGNMMYDFIGTRNTYSNLARMQTFISQSILKDPRVDSVEVSLPHVEGNNAYTNIDVKLKGSSDLLEIQVVNNSKGIFYDN